MLFYSTKQVLLKRYFTFITHIFLAIIFLGLLSAFLGSSLIFFKTLKAVITEPKIALIIFTPFLVLQIVSFFGTQKAINSLALEDQSLLYELFNKQKEKILYTDILSFSYTDDSFKNFEITLKNGEKKVIYPTIKKKEEAFKLIQQKILESQNKD